MTTTKNLWRSIKDMFSNTEIVKVQETKQIWAEVRAHERFSIWNPRTSFLTINGLNCLIKDISFGGIAIDVSNLEEIVLVKNPDPKNINLNILGEEHEVRLEFIRNANLTAGFRFQHTIPESLIFLAKFLENIRCGSTLKEIGKEHVKEKYQTKDWVTLRGDGPTDLFLRMDPANFEINEALICFLCNENYHELIYKYGILKTGKTIDRFGDSARAVQTLEIDKSIIRQANQILMGIRLPGLRIAVTPIVEASLASLNLFDKKPGPKSLFV